MLAGRRLEFETQDWAAAADVYRALLGGADVVAGRCRMINAVRLGLRRPTVSDPECQERKAPELESDVRCLARNGLARSLDRAGRSLEAAEQWERLANECRGFLDPSGYNLALGARLRRIELLGPSQPELALAAGDELARALADPRLPASADQRRFAAGRAVALLEAQSVATEQGVVERLRQLAFDQPLLTASAELGGWTEEGVSLRSVQVGGLRRMIVVRKHGALLAGAEVSASVLEPELQAWLSGLDIGTGVRARIRPAAQPVSDSEMELLAGSVLLTDGQFAWRLDLVLEGGQAIEQLTRSRTQLYIWVLALLVLVLVVGIAGTVWVMARETRLSRLKTDFVSSVSHELRTPLTSIRLFTETLLLGRAQSVDEQQEFLTIISHESERLSRLVERILDFSRMEAGRKSYAFQPVDLPELVEAAVLACRSLIEEREVRLRREVPGDLGPIEANRDALVEVLINLLSNAAKYSPVGSEVIVSARRVEDWLELSVSDQGIGIARADQQRIFDKFYRVETPLTSEVSGSGLGLSLVRYIVEGHGGQVWVDSALGRGSRFTVRLPLRQEAKG